MVEIYHNAAITIIDAVGGDANLGLVGVSTALRQPLMRACFLADD